MAKELWNESSSVRLALEQFQRKHCGQGTVEIAVIYQTNVVHNSFNGNAVAKGTVERAVVSQTNVGHNSFNGNTELNCGTEVNERIGIPS